MILIVTIDERNGMAFHHRRLSQDSVLTKRILEIADGRLWMNAYSRKLFPDSADIMVDENFPDKAKNDYCFAETSDISGYSFEKIILYRWNRSYPSDLKFSIDLSQYRLISTTDFKGTAHDTITEEVYVK
ncbi:MAG: hypothetical protein NC093_02455 [Alistipes sp.]|nr:hypothetical protein [Alistipes sp.]